MEFQWKQDAIDHAMQCDPEESCGIIAVKNNQEKYYPCKNISNEFKTESFVIDPLDWADGEDQGEVLGIVHSHPDGLFEFSHTDKISCKYNDLPFYLVDPKTESIIKLDPAEVDD